MVRKIVTAGIVAALLLVLAGCSAKHGNPHSSGGERLPSVETVQPERVALLPIRIEVTAQVEAMEKADLCARVPGTVESLKPDPDLPEIDIGRRVRAGQPLLKIAVPELEAEKRYKEALREQAERQLVQAKESQNVAARELTESREQEKRYQAEFTLRKAKHERTMKLVQSGSIQPELSEETKSQLDAAESAWQAARAQIETKTAKHVATDADIKVAESRIKVAREEAERLGVLVSYATIRAPFTGIVTRRLVDRGAMVKDAATPLLTVMRVDKMRVLMDIPERYVPLINATDHNPNADGKGDMVTLRIAALQDAVSHGEFRAPIERLAKALDPTTRTMRAEVHLSNDGDLLHHGMFGTASILLEERYDVLTVPSTALMRRNGKSAVFCVELEEGNPSQGRARSVEVELGVDDGRRVQIRGGLTGKELVIAKGNGVIHEGDKVQAVPYQQSEP